jgi:glycosyltransferase involved in cell wall biosynthesis
MSLVSVVVPAYNAAPYIQCAIGSVLDQTVADFELIVVDDCSTDQTAAIVSSFSDPRIKLLRTQHNSGVSGARNLGISQAEGALIALLDADDWWSPQKLELQIQALEAQQADLCYTWTYLFNQETHLTHLITPLISGQIYEQLMVQNFIGSIGSCIMFRADVIERIGGFDSALRYAEDWEFCLRAAKHFSYAVVAVPVTFYRQHLPSSSSNITQMRDLIGETVDKILAYGGDQYQYLRPRLKAGFYLNVVELCLRRSTRIHSGYVALCYYLRAIVIYPSVLLGLENLKTALRLMLFLLLPDAVKTNLFTALSRWTAEPVETGEIAQQPVGLAEACGSSAPLLEIT